MSTQVQSKPAAPAALAPPSEVVPVAPRKKIHFHPGTVALREIRREQKSTQTMLQRTPFIRMVRRITAKYGETMKFSRSAMCALQEMTEDYIVSRLRNAHNLAIYTNRKSLKANDLDMCASLQK